MRFLLFATLLAAVFLFVYADPILRLPENGEDLGDIPVHHRARRATCDLLSATKVKSTACAAHCLLKGHKGGYCNSKLVCVCR